MIYNIENTTLTFKFPILLRILFLLHEFDCFIQDY